MASYTTNLNLKKPAGSENVSIGDINGNMDAIDTAIGNINTKMNGVTFKNLGLEANTQKSLTISNSARFIIFFMSGYTNCNGVASFAYYVSGQCDGAVWIGGSAPAGITVNVSTNNVLKLTATGSTNFIVMVSSGTVTG